MRIRTCNINKNHGNQKNPKGKQHIETFFFFQIPQNPKKYEKLFSFLKIRKIQNTFFPVEKLFSFLKIRKIQNTFFPISNSVKYKQKFPRRLKIFTNKTN